MGRSRYSSAGQQQGTSTQSNGRRTRHVQRACDTCRVKRYKCDAGKPSCSQCRASHTTCMYTARVDLRRNLSKEEATALNEQIGLLETENRQLRQEKTNMGTEIWQLKNQLDAAKSELRNLRGSSPPSLSITTTRDDPYGLQLSSSGYLSSPSDGPPSSAFPSTPLNQTPATLFSENTAMHLQVPAKSYIGHHRRLSSASLSSISDGDAEGDFKPDITQHANQMLAVPMIANNQWRYPQSPSSSTSDGVSQLELLLNNTSFHSPNAFDLGNGIDSGASTAETYGESSLFPSDPATDNLSPGMYGGF